MKEKCQNSIRLLSALIFVCCSLSVSAQTITGPDEIEPGVMVMYTRTAATSLSFNETWTVTVNGVASPNVTVFGGGFSDVIYIKVSEDETNCNIKLAYVYKVCDDPYCSSQSASTETKSIKIAPFIKIPPIYPGEAISLSVQDNCGHTGCNYLWTVNPGAICPSCAPSGTSTQTIYINPTATIPPTINVNCTMSGCTPSFTNTALTTAFAQVKLRDPIITGLSSVGCSSAPPTQSNFIYTAGTVYGAATYSWTVPSYLTITGYPAPNQISVVENSTGMGQYITVQAVDASNQVFSDIVKFQVNVCCRSQYSITASVNAPNADKQQSFLYLDASNVINSGASGMYHAGSEVRLLPGFNAVAGSYFHGYIQACTGSFNREAGPDSSGNNSQGLTTGSQDITIQPADANTTNAIPASKEHQSVKVYPNPNTGSFQLALDNESGNPLKVTIQDVFGEIVYALNKPDKGTYEVDLRNFPNGIYLLRAEYPGYVYLNKLIKSH